MSFCALLFQLKIILRIIEKLYKETFILVNFRMGRTTYWENSIYIISKYRQIIHAVSPLTL